MLSVTDQFCGAGGSSIGAEDAGATLDLAMNHWALAIETHNSNFPNADHACADISTTDPRRYRTTDVLITSPECTNHSKAKSKPARDDAPGQMTFTAPTEEAERSRATMWDVPRFAEHHRYKAIIVENVVEAAKWDLFPAWLHAMELLGYVGQPVFLNSMVAHPTPQSRDRMYWVWWRREQRAPDLNFTAAAWCPTCEKAVDADQVWKSRTKAWPLPQWGKYRDQYRYQCPVCSTVVDPYAYPALAALDMSIAGQVIGDRKEPLRPATYARIERGLEKYGDMPPLILPVDNRPGKEGRPIFDPMFTQTGRQELALAVPPGFLIKNYGRIDEAKYRPFPWTDPLGAITTEDSHSVVGMPFLASLRGGSDDSKVTSALEPLDTFSAGGTHHALIVPPGMVVQVGGNTYERPGYTRARSDREPMVSATTSPSMAWVQTPPMFYVKNFGDGSDPTMSHPVTDALGAVTAHDHHGIVRMPFTTSYYGNGGTSPVVDALPTVTTRDRHALVVPGRRPTVEECTFRMLEPHEIQAAMAFPGTYKIVGNKRQKVRQLGNAVTPPVMRMIMERVVASLDEAA